MKRRAPAWLFLALGLLATFTYPSAATAARYIGTNGNASGSGRAAIIIESFGVPTGPRRPIGAQSPLGGATFDISVTIPSGSSAANTTIMIRDSADIVLPPEFVVCIPQGQSDVVSIFRVGGDFGITISEDVPGQTIVEIFSLGLPMLGPGGSSVLVALLVASGALVLTRRRLGGWT